MPKKDMETIDQFLLCKSESCCIYGSGGTGKTFMMKSVLNKYQYNGFAFVFLAPTHKAANILMKNGIKCLTICSFLSYKKFFDEEDNCEFLPDVDKWKYSQLSS